MLVNQFLNKYKNIEIDLILTHVLNKPKEFLYMNPGQELSSYQVKKLSRLVKRRHTGEPLAYILGYKDFYGYRFKVNKHVLVPRPETEQLVNKVFQVCKVHKVGEQIKILDVGTGSGCIAISIAKLLPISPPKALKGIRADPLQCPQRGLWADNIQISASDVSPAALKVAKKNATIHSVKIKFYYSDLLKSIKQNFDIVIANLPYGWTEWKNNTTQTTVGLKFEPKQALFTKEHGLYEIRRLLEQIRVREHQPKYIFLEFDPRQKMELQKLAKKILPKYKLTFHRDLRGLWRLLELCQINASYEE